MIRIRKRVAIPTPLASRGVADRLRLEGIYNADPAACKVPRNTHLKADGAIYGDEEVKDALIADQHEKCCYCESKFISTGFGDVEHFRPKAGVRQLKRGKLEKPGYYWLAYEWTNLFFSCEICNQRYKGNWFPLLNPGLRARQHNQAIARERTLLPDPHQTNPSRYLHFNRHIVTASKPRGQACIQAYGLDRDPLNRKREEYLNTLKFARFAASIDLAAMNTVELQEILTDLHMTLQEAYDFVDLARETWNQAAFDRSEYAGMVRANFPALPRR